MRSGPASIDLPVLFARESGDAYDAGREAQPADRMLTLLQQREALDRQIVDVWRDVAEWGGLPSTQGWTGHEYLTLVGRMSGRDARRLELLTSRLSALPITASLLTDGQITVEQAMSIAGATTCLAGADLAEVEREAAHDTADRNARGDDPDVGDAVADLVDRRRKPRDVERAERVAVEGSRLIGQQSFDGGGWLYAEQDAESYATTWTAIEHAAGTPTPDVPRRFQRAEGLTAMARAWLAGTTGQPTDGTSEPAPTPAPAPVSALLPDTRANNQHSHGSTHSPSPSRARPTLTVLVDLADATPSAAGQLLGSSLGGRAPRLSARLLDTLMCNANLLLQVTDGRRPLIELKDQQTVPAATRRAVLARDRGCRWPGCNAPPWMCDVHHLTPRADGGDHDPDNLVTLCRRHHRRTHSVHWTITLDPTTAAVHWSRRRDGSSPLHTTQPHGTRPPPAAQPR